MKKLLILIALLALPICAFAQDADQEPEGGDDAAAETEEQEEAQPMSEAQVSVSEDGEVTYERYFADGYGFSVLLPNTGVIEDPQSEGWQEKEAVAFNWFGADSDPISLIQGRVDDFIAEMDEETFRLFCDELAGNWESNDEKFNVTTKSTLTLGDRDWNILEIADRSNMEGDIYYSVWSSFEGNTIYTIAFYYMTPVNSEIQEFGREVLFGFNPE